MDFSQVNRVIINGKEVRVINCSPPGTIWMKRPAWHTVWEGKKKIGSSYSDMGGQENKFLFGTVPYSDQVRLKVSFLTDHNIGDMNFTTGIITLDDSIRMTKSEFIPANPSNPNDPPKADQSPVSYDNSAFVSTETTLAKASIKAVVGGAATDYNM